MVETDELIRATRFAIARAKHRGDTEVRPDDLLAGALHAAARFGIAVLGPLNIDLEELGEPALDELDAAGPKVAYSETASSVFDQAARIATRDGKHGIRTVHVLAAFANEENGLMGRIKSTYDIDSSSWRAALARTAQRSTAPRAPAAGRAGGVQELMSPDEAAEFLGVHTQTVRGYIRSGKLTAHRLAGERALRIRRRDLIDLLEPYSPD